MQNEKTIKCPECGLVMTTTMTEKFCDRCELLIYPAQLPDILAPERNTSLTNQDMRDKV